MTDMSHGSRDFPRCYRMLHCTQNKEVFVVSQQEVENFSVK